MSGSHCFGQNACVVCVKCVADVYHLCFNKCHDVFVICAENDNFLNRSHCNIVCVKYCMAHGCATRKNRGMLRVQNKPIKTIRLPLHQSIRI